MLLEDIAGKLGFVYHRTPAVKNVKSIEKNGFQVGNGAHYGHGIYFTYDLKSQLRKDMSRYGNTMLKMKLKLDKFIILDKYIAQKVYGKYYKLSDQMKILEFPVNDTTKKIIEDAEKSIEKHNERSHFGGFARDLYKSNENTIMKYCNGLMYYGGHNDGNAGVVFRTELIQLVASANVRGVYDVNKIEWKPVKKLASNIEDMAKIEYDAVEYQPKLLGSLGKYRVALNPNYKKDNSASKYLLLGKDYKPVSELNYDFVSFDPDGGYYNTQFMQKLIENDIIMVGKYTQDDNTSKHSKYNFMDIETGEYVLDSWEEGEFKLGSFGNLQILQFDISKNIYTATGTLLGKFEIRKEMKNDKGKSFGVMYSSNSEDGKAVILNSKGETIYEDTGIYSIIQPIYWSIKGSENGSLVYIINRENKLAVFNLDTLDMTDFIYDFGKDHSDRIGYAIYIKDAELYMVQIKNEKAGLIEYNSNKIIIPFIYDNIMALDQYTTGKYFAVVKNGKLGLFDVAKKEEVISPTYAVIKKQITYIYCEEDRAKQNFDLYNLDYEFVGNYTSALIGFNDGNVPYLALRDKNGLCGVVNLKTKKEVIPFKFDKIETIPNGDSYYVVVKVDNDDSKEGYISNSTYGLYDLNGEELAPPIYDYINSIKSDKNYVIVINSNNEKGVYDLSKKKEVIPIKYRNIFYLSDNCFKVEDGRDLNNIVKGVIDNNNNILVPLHYYDITAVPNYKAENKKKFFIVQSKDTRKYGLFSNNKIVVPTEYNSIYVNNAGDGLLLVHPQRDKSKTITFSELEKIRDSENEKDSLVKECLKLGMYEEARYLIEILK